MGVAYNLLKKFAVRAAEDAGEQAAKKGSKSIAAKDLTVLPKAKRKMTPAQVAEHAATRVRAEARTRAAANPAPSERRAARATYTVPPAQITPDPELSKIEFVPGSEKSVTEQAAEMGVPVVGLKPFEVQHPTGYSTSWGDAKPSPLNVTTEYRDRVPDLEADVLDESSIPIGSGLFPMVGDATIAGKDLISINGMPLKRPVSGFGGARYGWGERGAGRRGVWASDVGVVENQAKQIRDWQNENPGQDVFGVHVNMGPSGSDFSHQTSAVIANLLPHMNLTDEAKRKLDDYVRSGVQGLPDFIGFADDPYVGLVDLMTRAGGERKAAVKRLADVTKGAQLEGIPADLGALSRLGVAEPGLRLAPQGSSGFSVVKFDPENFLQVDPALLSGPKRRAFETSSEYANLLGDAPDLHRVDYNAILTGDPQGQFKQLTPYELLWNEIAKNAARFDKKGNPTSSGMRWTSFARHKNPIVTYTPELQDRFGQYLQDVAKYGPLGFAEGGSVEIQELASKYAD